MSLLFLQNNLIRLRVTSVLSNPRAAFYSLQSLKHVMELTTLFLKGFSHLDSGMTCSPCSLTAPPQFPCWCLPSQLTSFLRLAFFLNLFVLTCNSQTLVLDFFFLLVLSKDFEVHLLISIITVLK